MSRQRPRMALHLRFVGISLILWSLLALVGGLVLASRAGVDMLTTVALMAAAFVPVALFAGIALLTNISWGRPWAIAACVMALPVLPLGTAVGGYGLWVLTHADTVALFTARRMAASSRTG